MTAGGLWGLSSQAFFVGLGGDFGVGIVDFLLD
jgi:hypothetical protein